MDGRVEVNGSASGRSEECKKQDLTPVTRSPEWRLLLYGAKDLRRRGATYFSPLLSKVSYLVMAVPVDPPQAA